MITLTKTMIEKSIIDANETVRQFAADNLAVNFDAMECGEKKTIPATMLIVDGAATLAADSEIRFYRTNNARGDRRVSFKDLRKNGAQPGDIVKLELVYGRAVIWLIHS